MASVRNKDTAVARAAAVRRRQRVTTAAPQSNILSGNVAAHSAGAPPPTGRSAFTFELSDGLAAATDASATTSSSLSPQEYDEYPNPGGGPSSLTHPTAPTLSSGSGDSSSFSGAQSRQSRPTATVTQPPRPYTSSGRAAIGGRSSGSGSSNGSESRSRSPNVPLERSFHVEEGPTSLLTSVEVRGPGDAGSGSFSARSSTVDRRPVVPQPAIDGRTVPQPRPPAHLAARASSHFGPLGDDRGAGAHQSSENINNPKPRPPRSFATDATNRRNSSNHQPLVGSSGTTAVRQGLPTSSVEPILEEEEDRRTGDVDDDYEEGLVLRAEEEQTIEELEPNLGWHDSTTDAACLGDGSTIMIQCHGSRNRTIRAEPQTLTTNRGRSDSPVEFRANPRGIFLGEEPELLRLVLFTSFVDPSRPSHPPVLRYGHRVAFRSSYGNDFALGVRWDRSEDDSQTKARLRVGFFRSTATGSNEQWTVLRAIPGRAVRLGKDAVVDERIIAAATRSKPELTAPVRSGDGVILRHVQTGAVLSLRKPADDGLDPESRDPHLVLLTNSFDPNRVPHGVAASSSLLGRLQRHDRLTPSGNDIFHIVLSTVPPIPLWINTTTLPAWQLQALPDQRPYLNGSHLLYPARFDNAVGEGLFFDSALARTMPEQSGYLISRTMEDLRTTRGQERVLIDESLGSFLGLQCQYIKFTSGQQGGLRRGEGFQLVPARHHEWDPILRTLVESMLPLSNSYATVHAFLASHTPGYPYGIVMQALCEGLDQLLQEYAAYVASLQNSRQVLTLRTLEIQVRQALHAMSVLERVVETVQEHKGGSLLNQLRALKLLHYEGDQVADRLLRVLLDASSGPYLRMLHGWLKRGDLADPHGEFMIQARKTDSWEDLYTVCPEHILEGLFSTKVTVDQVLAAGRYWNAIRACRLLWEDPFIGSGEQAEGMRHSTPAFVLRWTTARTEVSSHVQRMYEEASSALLHLLLDESDLMGALRLMKRYFLLDHGDFVVNFLDTAEDELLKELPSVSRGRVQHWLSQSVGLTEFRRDDAGTRDESQQLSGPPRRLAPTDLRCAFASESLVHHLDRLQQVGPAAATGGVEVKELWTPLRHAYGGKPADGLTGIDAFVLDFAAVPFPISLILSQSALACYQVLFRHIFYAKHVERRLVGIWKDHQAMRELQTSLRSHMGPTYLLRQRMLHFVQNLIYYIVLEVIEPNWLEMEAAVASPTARADRTVDDILHVHGQFLHRTMEACLLSNREVVRSLTKLMKTCLMFSDVMKRFMKATKIDEDRQVLAIDKQRRVQQNLNDRSAGPRTSPTVKHVFDAMKQGRLERNQRIQRQTRRTQREVSGDSYQRMIARFDEVFSDNLREFMQKLWNSDDLYHSHKVNLCIRLDFNGFVTSALGLGQQK